MTTETPPECTGDRNRDRLLRKRKALPRMNYEKSLGPGVSCLWQVIHVAPAFSLVCALLGFVVVVSSPGGEEFLAISGDRLPFMC